MKEYVKLHRALLAIIVFMSIVGLSDMRHSLAQQVQPESLTVRDIQIDKTADDAVKARQSAMLEARRAALQKLVSRYMGETALKTFSMPDDKTIASLVRDFEIVNEKIATGRYVGTFTVRFKDTVSYYVKTGHVNKNAEVVSGPTILILPYFETKSGELLLWEDRNAWRDIWQNQPPRVGGRTALVPLGDISDISAGSAIGIWQGDTAAVEKLADAYQADQVVLAVLNTSGYSGVVDVYVYEGTVLAEKVSLVSTTVKDDLQEVFRQAKDKVRSFLEKRLRGQKADAQSQLVQAVRAPGTPAVEKISIPAQMSFTSFMQWMDVQKRLATLKPDVTMDLKSLSSGTAKFDLMAEGSLETVQAALAAAGLLLRDPPQNQSSFNGAFKKQPYILDVIRD